MLFNKIKNYFKKAYAGFVFWLSATNNPLFIYGYKWLFNPHPESIHGFLDRFSKNREVFVFQVGANDGITHDPIHVFAKRDNWSGILLEPQAYVFNKFLVPIYKRNKGIIPVNAAIGYDDGTATLYRIGISNERWATGLASFDKQSLQDLYDDGIVEKRAAKAGQKVTKDTSNHIVGDEIKTYSPTSLIKKYNVEKIDLLMIDAEGFDYEVIKMFDMDLVKPKCIIFERTHLGAEERAECDAFLTKLGYQFKDIKANTVAWQAELNKLMDY
jgi:FkbM family methyltransferase